MLESVKNNPTSDPAPSVESRLNQSSKEMENLSSCITFPFAWLRSKMILTTEEFEIFEELLEGAFWGGATLLYDVSKGEHKILEVGRQCDDLYRRLSLKWFPNVEGILFLRQNLLKIRMRIDATFGDQKKVEKVQKEFRDIGGEMPETMEIQIKILSLLSRRVVRFFIRILNLFVKLGVNLTLFFAKSGVRGRRDSNPQLPP